MWSAVAWMAAQPALVAATSPEPALTLVNYGALGLILLLLLTRQFALYREVASAMAAADRAHRDATQARADLVTLQSAMIEDVVPALTRVTDVTGRAIQALDSTTRRLIDGG